MADAHQCRECRRGIQLPRGAGRGLCERCYKTPEVRARHPSLAGGPARPRPAPRGEPTEAELDALIAEQMARLPEWWGREARKMKGRAPRPEDPD